MRPMQKKLNSLLLIIAVCLAISSCVSPPGGEAIYEGMDNATQNKMKQYYVQGKILYQTHCQNCHKEEGEGMGRLIPPLAASDYLLNDANNIACLIKKGQIGEIVVNGQTYNQPMPAHTDMTALEIAEIMTYIKNSWGNKKGLIDVNTTQKALQECK